jgi:hypothetical protein
MEYLRSCHDEYERGCRNSATTTSVRRLANILHYEILLEILNERIANKTELEYIQRQINSLQEKVDFMKKFIED